MATTATTDRKVFPFFKLARELRDQIYDECLVHRSIKRDRGPWCHARNMASASHLLVSRQFSSEYNERAEALSQCRIVDHTSLVLETFADRLDSDIRTVPRPFAKITLFRFNLACYDDFDELTGHALWLRRYLKQLASMQSLVVCISFSMLNFDKPGMLINAVNRTSLLRLRKLKQLELYLVASGMKNQYIANNGSKNHKLIAKLSKESGKVEAVED